MFLCSNQLKIVNFYKLWSNMKILMLFHNFDVNHVISVTKHIPWILLMNLFKPTQSSDSLV